MADKKAKGDAWVKEALAGKYQFGTGGKDKSMRPGFSKKGSVAARVEKKQAKAQASASSKSTNMGYGSADC